MKKIVALLQILIFLFFAFKIAALAGMMQKTATAADKASQVNSQNHSAPVKNPVAAPLPEEKKDLTGGAQALVTALAERQKVLDKKEAFLKAEELKLQALKKEIVEKLEMLKASQEKINAELEKVSVADAKRYKDLAKVFDSTPAAKAGAMLEVMDLKTAAGITMNMKKDKAGAIWGYLSPKKAVEITYEITSSGRQKP